MSERAADTDESAATRAAQEAHAFVYKNVKLEHAEDFSSLPRVRLACVGDSGVGKTTLALRFANRNFDSGVRSTVGVDFVNAHIEVCGVPMNVQIWDTAGQEHYNAMTTTFVRDCGGVLITFDATNTTSFASCKRWRALVRDINPDAVCMLVATKADKYRSSNVDANGKTARGWLDAIDMGAKADELECTAGFVLTSGKTGDNVDLALVKLAHMTYNKTQRWHATTLVYDGRSDAVELSRKTNADRKVAVNCCRS